MPNQPAIKSYAQLDVWNLGMELVVRVYSLTKSFPTHERFGLTSQLQRAAVSIVANVAEGHERETRAEYRRFVSMSRGSLAELETELLIAERLGYGSSDDLAAARNDAVRVGQMLTKLRKSLAT